MKPEEFLKKLRGPFMHLATSYKLDNIWEIDDEAMRSNLRFMLQKGSKIINVCSTESEWGYVTDEERKACWKTLIDEAKGKALCIATTSHGSTKKAIEMTKYAEQIGVDGLVIECPTEYALDAEGIYRHYKTIADSTSLGIIVYNSWGVTHKENINPTILESLVQIPNIVAIAESSPDVEQYLGQISVMEKYNKAVICASGEKNYVAGVLISDNVVGCSSAVSCWDPMASLNLFDALERRNMPDVIRCLRDLDIFLAFRQRVVSRSVSAQLAANKEPLDMIDGLKGGINRPPAEPLNEAERHDLRETLLKMGFILKE